MTIRAKLREADDESDERIAALRTLPGFFAFATEHAVPAHLRRVMRGLQDISTGVCDRLMVTLPPGHGKSITASTVFPAWYLFQKPNIPLIMASHTHELAAHFGRRVRNIYQRPESRAITGCGLADDSSSAARFSLTNGSDLFAVGVGGAITGRRARGAIIDDPLRGIEDADSERIRNRTYEWYRADLETRLLPGGWVVLINTRWHEDDLAGRLLRDERDRWRIIDMPALSDDGEALWPEMYDAAHLLRIRASIPKRMWSALYQQNPTPEEGTTLTRQMIHLYQSLPEHVNYYLSSDYALSDDAGDYTVHLLAAWDGQNLYVHDLYRARKETDETVSAMLDLAVRYNTTNCFGESGPIEKAIGPMIRSAMRERDVMVSRSLLPSIVSKETRAMPLQGLMGMGRVRIRAEQPWTDTLIAELLAFPSGRNDDQVDALSLLARGVDMMQQPLIPKPAGSDWCASSGFNGNTSWMS